MTIGVVGPINTGEANASGVANKESNRLTGRIVAVAVAYNVGGCSSSCDLLVKTVGGSGSPPSYDILSLEDNITDGEWYPHRLVSDIDGNDIADVYTDFYVADKLDISIAEADEGDDADVWILIDSD